MIFSGYLQSSVADFKLVEFDEFKTQAAFFDVTVPTVRRFRIVRSEASGVRKIRTATRLIEAATCKRYLQVGQEYERFAARRREYKEVLEDAAKVLGNDQDNSKGKKCL